LARQITSETMNFTIITPNLNHGRFLGECLGSVAAQEGVALEHLVMDGGSTDDSAAVAARFPGVVWVSEKDGGMSAAINKGFARAKGDWVMWLNADDRLKPGALASVLRELKGTDADIVYADWNLISENGDHIRHIRAVKWSRFVHVHHHCYVASTAAWYRRDTVIAEGHRLREDFHYVMDGEFYARMDAIGKRFFHVRVDAADFRLHPGNASLRHSGITRDMDTIIAAERQHAESRAIRRAHGFTWTHNPYLNGISDGLLWIVAKAWKGVKRLLPF